MLSQQSMADAEREATRGTIQLYDGAGYRPKAVIHAPYDVGVIAHSLSNICRFGGHTKGFYSVAEHCVRGSHEIAKTHALAFLLHDAPEAYTGFGDVLGTVKERWLRDQENNIMMEMAPQFGLDWPMPKSVHAIDQRMLATEKRDVMKRATWWKVHARPFKFRIESWASEEAEKRYLLRFGELTK